LDVPRFDSSVGIDNNVKQQTPTNMSNQDKIFQKVNDAVLEGLKRDGMKWFMPWKSGDVNQPMSYNKKYYYKGFNVFMLNAVMMAEGYEHNQWLTENHCRELGGSIKSGEFGNTADVYKWTIGFYDAKKECYVASKNVKKINQSEKIVINGKRQLRYRKTFSIRYWQVYNVDQCNGIVPHVLDAGVPADNKPIEIADQLSKSYVDRDGKLVVCHLFGDRAFYNVETDTVNMPKLNKFVDSDSYYKVLFHELAHSTGHKDRMDRKTLTEISFWGDNTYAKEELVAEISAMYISGLLGLDPKDDKENSIAYIKGWCKALEDKPKECLYAMQQATKIVAYIQGK